MDSSNLTHGPGADGLRIFLKEQVHLTPWICGEPRITQLVCMTSVPLNGKERSQRKQKSQKQKGEFLVIVFCFDVDEAEDYCDVATLLK